MEDSLRSLCERGARMVRLDAYGYATKKKGTRCFFEVCTLAPAISKINLTLHNDATLCTSWIMA